MLFSYSKRLIFRTSFVRMKTQRYPRINIAIFLILFTPNVFSQWEYHPQLPPSVDIPVRNILQETEVWCWAAVAQQVINYMHGSHNTPPQCHLVAVANGAHPAVCCQEYNPLCIRTGSMSQIQFLIEKYSWTYTSYNLPTSPQVLYNTLASRKIVILSVQSGFMASHVIVLRGMYFIPTPYGVEAMLLVNDPLSHFPQAVPFSQIVGMWIGAIVVSVR